LSDRINYFDHGTRCAVNEVEVTKQREAASRGQHQYFCRRGMAYAMSSRHVCI